MSRGSRVQASYGALYQNIFFQSHTRYEYGFFCVIFVAKDIAEMLGYKDQPKAIEAHIDEEDKITFELPTTYSLN